MVAAPISVSEPIVARSGMEIAAWASRVTTPPVSRTASVFRFRKRAISAGLSWKMRTRNLVLLRDGNVDVSDLHREFGER